jgi:hypothetical protein
MDAPQNLQKAADASHVPWQRAQTRTMAGTPRAGPISIIGVGAIGWTGAGG